MSEAKPTPGEWLVIGETFVYALNDRGYNRFNAQVQPGHIEQEERTPAAELAANASLFADAGNTYNTTGLTPSQLVERVKELEGALRGLDEAYCRAGSPLTREERFEDRKRLIAARAALSKARPNTAEGEAQSAVRKQGGA